MEAIDAGHQSRDILVRCFALVFSSCGLPVAMVWMDMPHCVYSWLLDTLVCLMSGLPVLLRAPLWCT